MTYFFIGGAVLLAALAVYQYARRLGPGQLLRILRWPIGGALALTAGFLLLARRFDIALFAGAAAFSILRSGRLGPFSFDGGAVPGESNASKVRSRYLAMELDHDTGAVHGRVLDGQFAGADLIDLGEMDTRLLIAEIEGDTDSMSLLESWLDANRSGGANISPSRRRPGPVRRLPLSTIRWPRPMRCSDCSRVPRTRTSGRRIAN